MVSRRLASSSITNTVCILDLYQGTAIVMRVGEIGGLFYNPFTSWGRDILPVEDLPICPYRKERLRNLSEPSGWFSADAGGRCWRRDFLYWGSALSVFRWHSD